MTDQQHDDQCASHYRDPPVCTCGARHAPTCELRGRRKGALRPKHAICTCGPPEDTLWPERFLADLLVINDPPVISTFTKDGVTTRPLEEPIQVESQGGHVTSTTNNLRDPTTNGTTEPDTDKRRKLLREIIAQAAADANVINLSPDAARDLADYLVELTRIREAARHVAVRYNQIHREPLASIVRKLRRAMSMGDVPDLPKESDALYQLVATQRAVKKALDQLKSADVDAWPNIDHAIDALENEVLDIAPVIQTYEAPAQAELEALTTEHEQLQAELVATRRYAAALARGLSDAEARAEGWPDPS